MQSIVQIYVGVYVSVYVIGIKIYAPTTLSGQLNNDKRMNAIEKCVKFVQVGMQMFEYDITSER